MLIKKEINGDGDECSGGDGDGYGDRVIKSEEDNKKKDDDNSVDNKKEEEDESKEKEEEDEEEEEEDDDDDVMKKKENINKMKEFLKKNKHPNSPFMGKHHKSITRIIEKYY